MGASGGGEGTGRRAGGSALGSAGEGTGVAGARPVGTGGLGVGAGCPAAGAVSGAGEGVGCSPLAGERKRRLEANASARHAVAKSRPPSEERGLSLE
ncbi:MAG: hypothetical protein QHH30_03450 [candidate division NC10 bacterium]|nr:hypothetical protein [candidate division NC10 bacterium]